jgi:hypothetical protein
MAATLGNDRPPEELNHATNRLHFGSWRSAWIVDDTYQLETDADFTPAALEFLRNCWPRVLHRHRF